MTIGGVRWKHPTRPDPVPELERGELWWVEHPNHRSRPHLVLHRNAIVNVLPRVLAVPATRTRRGIPTEVELDESDGVPAACVLSLDNLTLLDRGQFTRRITRLGPERMAAVCAALRVATGC